MKVEFNNNNNNLTSKSDDDIENIIESENITYRNHDSDTDSSLNFDDLDGVERVSGSSLQFTEDDEGIKNGSSIELVPQSTPQKRSEESVITVSSIYFFHC